MSRTSSSSLNRRLESELYESIQNQDWDYTEELLVEASELPVVRRTADNTLLHCATEQEGVPPDVIRKLSSVLLSWQRHATNKWGLTPLHNAILFRQNLDVISVLLEIHLVAIDMADRSGRTPMDNFFTRLLEREEEEEEDEHPDVLSEDLIGILRLLTRAWMEYYKTSGSCRLSTPLHRALQVAFFHKDLPMSVLKILLETSPSMAQVQDGNGCTPLHLASRHDDHNANERLQLLLNATPTVVLEWRDENGRTPLSSAVFWFASLEIFETLVAANPASVFIPDNDNKTPLDLVSDLIAREMAVSEYTLNVAETLVMGRRNSDSVLRKSILLENCPVELVRVFLRAFPQQALWKDEKGNLPLHLAATLKPKPPELVAFTSLLKELVQAFPAGPKTTNDAGLLPLASFICAERKWNEGLGTIFQAHPAAVMDQGLPPCAVTQLLSKLGKCSDNPTVLYQLLQDAPSLVSRV